MDITPFLQAMVQRKASDLYFSTNAPANIKVEGVTTALNQAIFPPGAIKKLAYSIMSEEQIKAFEETLEMDLAISIKNAGRFRVNIFRQRGEVSIVIRYITSRIPPIDELKLPQILNQLAMEQRGLILIVGTTGSGKSTSLASMLQHRNKNASGHILTIEDPIEFIHQHERSIINQREIGIDTYSYENALKRAMREAPDVIMIGEIRDQNTMQQAIAYADTGHLCLTTLHATNAYQTLDRIFNFFPDRALNQLQIDLSLNLKAIVSQRLIIGVNGKRVPAVEVMLNTPHIADLVQKGDIENIREAIQQSNVYGMKTFDQALYELYLEGKISEEEALKHAESKNNLSLQIRLNTEHDVSGNDQFSLKSE
jgi:twitching motility protein PilU